MAKTPQDIAGPAAPAQPVTGCGSAQDSRACQTPPQLVQSRDNERLRRVCRLLDDGAARAEAGLFAAEGAKLCADIAAVRPPVEVWYTAEAASRYPDIPRLGGAHYMLAGHAAEKLARTRSTQGVWAVFGIPQPPKDAFCGRRLLALDGVQDPGNLGAVLRSAAAFGWQGVLLGPGCADPYGPKALRAGMSATVKLPIRRTQDLGREVAGFAARGYVCLAARLQNAQALPAVEDGTPCLLVIGSEGQGISPAVSSACTMGAYIPIAPAMESLNAAVAAGVLMWHYRPQG